MTSFKAMTWNVENLFRPKPGASTADQQGYQRKLELLAQVINNLSPDIVALQEVGGEEPLHDLQVTLNGNYPHREVSDFPDRRGIRVAFLAKHPMEKQSDIVDFPPGPALDIHTLTASGDTKPINRMGRGALHVRVTKDNLIIDLITTHLKSKLLTFPRPGGSSFSPRDENERAQVAGIALMRRMAEAVTLRLQANGLLVGNNRLPLIVLGDLNDVPDAQTSLIFNGPPGSEIGTRGFQTPDKGDDARLFNLAPLISLDRRYSRIHRGRKELLDQIFVSEELLPLGIDGRRILPTVDSHVDIDGSLPSINEDPTTRTKDISPDHSPVIAEFDL